VNFLRETAAGIVVMVNGGLSPGFRKNPGCAAADRYLADAAARYHRPATTLSHGGAAGAAGSGHGVQTPCGFCRPRSGRPRRRSGIATGLEIPGIRPTDLTPPRRGAPGCGFFAGWTALYWKN
jgi:hypothetical protein